MVQDGQVVNVHYVGTFDDGTEFDSSRTRGETFAVQVGAGQVIPGFDNALRGMEVGEVKNVNISPDDGYGAYNDAAVEVVPRNLFPPDMPIVEGQQVQGNTPNGPILATIKSFSDSEVTIDRNHPLAGKSLNFEIEVVSLG